MVKSHLAYLNLGSNIQPEINLPKAFKLLSEYGEILQTSRVWESEPIGLKGENFLNVCLKYKTIEDQFSLKDHVLQKIEIQLGRKHTTDKFASRTMDIDIILFDNEPLNEDCWSLPFVVVPLADIYPDYQIVSSGETILAAASRLRQKVWLVTRLGVLD